MTRLPTVQQWLVRGCALILMVSAIGGCGYHLRNAVAVPADLGPLRIVSRHHYSQLAKDLSEALYRAGAIPAPTETIVDDSGADDSTVATTAAGDATTDDSTADASATVGANPGVATLKILSERWGNTPLSVDQRGRAQEHTLRYAVVFQLTRADGSVLVPEQVIELSRDYISAVSRSSGTEGEREILAQELRKAMVGSILRRIDLAFKNPPPLAAPAVEPGDTAPPTVPATPPADAPEPAPVTP